MIYNSMSICFVNEQYLERRFGSSVRLVASLLYSTQMLLYMGVVLYAPAIALEALTGLSRNFSVFVVGIVCTLYSAIGGIKAVIYTDVFQVISNFQICFVLVLIYCTGCLAERSEIIFRYYSWV